MGKRGSGFVKTTPRQAGIAGGEGDFIKDILAADFAVLKFKEKKKEGEFCC